MRSVTSILDSIGVEYVDKGPNVRKGNVNIHCPFCGAADPSKHLGINIETGVWGCWRSVGHAGRKLSRLIATLARCSFDDAENIINDGLNIGTSVSSLLKSMDKKRKKEKPDAKLVYDFKHVEPVMGKRYFDYLEDRGFHKISNFVSYYSIRCANHGNFKGRLILPVFCNGLKGWTARTIFDREPRYLAHPEGETIKQNIFNYDRAAHGSQDGGRSLVLCEGPFDALKVDWCLKQYGVRSVALMGVMATGPQIGKIMKLSGSFQNIILLLDKSATGESIRLSQMLAGVKTSIRTPTAKDPADMDKDQLKKLLLS